MARIKSDIYKHYTELETRRFKKAKMLCDENNITFDTDVFNLLKTRNHCDDLLFSTEDLEEDLREDSEVAERRQVAEVIEEELTSNDDDGRLTGVFVSGNVVNLSRKVLSEGEVKLLSRGLKFSPTPRDIDKGQLKADLDILKRRMRLKWFFKDSEESEFDPKAFYIKSSWNPPRADPIL